jgi:hypothetical protein
MNAMKSTMLVASAHVSVRRLIVPLLVSVTAGLVMASCVQQPSDIQQTQSSSPSVTYKYHGDQELVQANQNAASYCNQYQSVAQTKNFFSDPDGTKVVVFECVHMAPVAALPPQYNPNLSYSYVTDQQLVDASRNAQISCMNAGSPQVTSTISSNTNGTRSVSFQCGPPR